MSTETITVKLTSADLQFINESIGGNVASPDHMTEAERYTSEKMRQAQVKLRRKGQS